MSATVPCTPCCATTQVTNVPGRPGDPGDPGTNGVNAFSIAQSDFNIPAVVGNTVTVSVNSTLWMVTGQTVIAGQGLTPIVSGAGVWGTFRISTINSLTSVTLTWLQFGGDAAGGTTISSGAVISPEGGLFASPLPIASGGTGAANVAAALTNLGLGYTPLTVYGSGTPYSLTNAVVQIDMGTTDPILTITAAGTYLILANINYDYVGATTAGETATSYLRRTNNTPATLSASQTIITLAPALVTYSGGAENITSPPLIYTTANATDTLGLFAGLSAGLGAGNLKVTACSIVAVKLY